ncbi:hypothetical protein [Streptomyces bobili]|uniref:hypothetical protein n=1 Tax=Streptomyces bobili TaxID=67280 RepID=UPI000A372689|nr:hypothetical protein [Streptomyces bobili]
MGIRSFGRSLRPGRDQQLAADLSAQRSRNHRRGATRADRAGQAWEDQERADERARRGRWSR